MRCASLYVLVLLTAYSFIFQDPAHCLDEFTTSDLEKSEEEDFSEPAEQLLEEYQRSLSVDDSKEWEPKATVRTSSPTISKLPNALANLPLRFGRALQNRFTQSIANLPLRFGRTLEYPVPRAISNLPQRFGRSPVLKTSAANLPQRFGRFTAMPQFLWSTANLPKRLERHLPVSRLPYSMLLFPLGLEGPQHTGDMASDLSMGTDE
ncbi:pro-FMRFamide-related neuropeptide VF [Protopterus annectens]|uniref:pro-FMRFamide-related neuropeptide VF n=1 Tax=Protopterus annectens TaxID=7888 RepID=UPI001CF99956|nr:pro-FMRFamide-related neuropeptide VF [Protopterus annectens]